MLRFTPSSDKKKYNQMRKEWDNLHNTTSHSKSHILGKLVAVFIVLAFVAFFFFLPKIRESIAAKNGDASVNDPISMAFGDPYYMFNSNFNGVEMHELVDSMLDLLQTSTNYYNDLQHKLFQKEDTKATLTAWTDFLNTKEEELQNLTKHGSFDEAYQFALEYIQYNRQMIEEGNFSYDELVSLNQQKEYIIGYIYLGFDRNGIQYSLDEDGSIQYWYEE